MDVTKANSEAWNKEVEGNNWWTRIVDEEKIINAKNGKPEFMYGISTLMEFIAYESSEKDYDDFQKIWFENFQKSIDNAKKQ